MKSVRFENDALESIEIAVAADGGTADIGFTVSGPTKTGDFDTVTCFLPAAEARELGNYLIQFAEKSYSEHYEKKAAYERQQRQAARAAKAKEAEKAGQK